MCVCVCVFARASYISYFHVHLHIHTFTFHIIHLTFSCTSPHFRIDHTLLLHMHKNVVPAVVHYMTHIYNIQCTPMLYICTWTDAKTYTMRHAHVFSYEHLRPSVRKSIFIPMRTCSAWSCPSHPYRCGRHDCGGAGAGRFRP